MKRIISVLFLWWGLCGSLCCAQPADEVFDAQRDFFERLPTTELNAVIDELNEKNAEPLPRLDWQTVKETAQNGLSFDGAQFFEKLLRLAAGEILANLSLLGKLVCLVAVCALLRNLELAANGSGLAKLSGALCFAALLLLAIKVFYSGVALVRTTVAGMVSLMNALLPIFLTLLTVSGNLTASALLSPLLIFAVNSISFVADKVVLPLLVMSAALECTNYFTSPYKLRGLAGLMKQSGMLLLGFMMALFLGVLAIQGTAGGISDGLALRTAKFAASSFVPVVGKLLSDTVEVLFGASLLLRSSIGIFGAAAVFLVSFAPCVKIFMLGLLVKLSGVCMEPMGDVRMASCMASIGSNLYLLAGVMLLIAVMFFLMLTMFVVSGSVAAMLK